MPIISKVGRRSFKVRFTFGLIIGLLSLGALTMIYPLLLMLSGSVKSQADFADLTPLPRFAWDDEVLWQKYVETKYANLREAEKAYRRPINNWSKIKQAPLGDKWVDAFESFRKESTFPPHWYIAGY